MAKINTGIIPDLNTSWENYAGSSVEEFIKRELKNSCGYIYRSRNKEGDYYYLYGFQSIDDFYKWSDGDTITPLFKVQLPNLENDICTVTLSTSSNTAKLVNLGDGVKVYIRYTSTTTNPTTGETSDTFNDGTLVIMRSANGSVFTEVGRITIQPQSYSGSSYQVLDLTNYLSDGDNKIRLRVEDNVNGSISNNITFQSIVNTSLVLSDATDNTVPLTAFNLQYYIQGQIAKTLHIRVTDASGASNSYSLPIGDNTYIEVPYSVNLSGSYATGVIDVESWLTVDDTTLESTHIHSQFFFISEDSDDSIIILNNKATTVTNYSNTKFFDFSLFNQPSDVEISITDGSTTFLTYTYLNCTVGTSYSFYNTLEIESSADSIDALVVVRTKDMTTSYSIVIDNSVKMSPTEGADFILNPKTRSNSEAIPDKIINSANGSTVTSGFDGFGFVSDGWVNDDDGIGVLRIPSGRSVTIEYDPLDTLTNGTTIELDYKVYNVYNDNDVVLKFCSYSNDIPLGFEMKATEAVFMTTEKQTRRDQDVIFQEDTRTHLAINIIPNLSASGLNYIRIFINGIMNREILYTGTDIFKNGTLTIDLGSDNCDMDIYGIRVYKKGLSASDVRQDYMASLPDAESKVAFMTANDIVSANGTISYDKAVVKYNTLVWTGNHPEYITGSVEYTGDLTISIIGDLAHSGTINGMKIKGQGSSSKGYWRWNHQYNFRDESVWVDGNGNTVGAYYLLSDNSPKATKLVAKLNWASSMQSHKMGSTSLYNDLWKAVIGGNSITKTTGYETSRIAVEEKVFLYFTKDTPSSNPVFAGLVTFGSAKGDVATFQGDSDTFSNYLMVEGSDNGMPLTLRQAPWIDDEVTYDSEEKYWVYNGEGQLDYDLGNKNNIGYFKNAFNFAYLHSTRLKPYTSATELLDTSYQYWNTSTYNVVRYDHITDNWVNAGITKDSEGRYDSLNICTQTGITPSGNSTTDNASFIAWRIQDFKAKVGNYYNVNDVLFTMAFLKLIAASDNWCKNTYEYLDPVTMKICMAQDDMDTIFLTDNVGRKTKPYYVEEHDKNGTSNYWNGEDNVFFNLMETAYNTEYRAMMKSILDTMGSSEFGGSVQACLQRYFFNIQEYIPSVAYNETARILYEEASVAQSQGIYKNGTPAISQSLGDQLQAEKQWWKRRLPYIQSWASSNPFYVRSTGSMGFRSMLTTDSSRPSYTFYLTPWQWLYPKIGVGQSMGADNTRVQANDTYTTSTITTDGNTDTFIYGANYYTNYGEFGDKSIGEAFELSGDRLLEFSADSRKVSSYQFRPTSMTVNCPVLKKLVLYGCSTLSGSLDLSRAYKLEDVDLRGTGLNTVIFPSSEHLKTVSVPNLSSITIMGSKNLTDFYSEGYSNLKSLTTDSSTIADTVLRSTATLTELHLTNILLDYSEDAATSNKLFDVLIADETTATGSIILKKQITQAQKQALVNKYGNIDSHSNPLYIQYTIKTQTSITIVGDSSVAQGRSKTYSVSYDGNDFKSYQWEVTGAASYTVDKNVVTVTASTTSLDSITINCYVARVNNSTLSDTKTVTVYENVPIQRIELIDGEISTTGRITIPLTIVPSNYTVSISDVRATISANSFAEVQSTNVSGVVLNVIGKTSTQIQQAVVTATVTDSDNNVFNAYANIYFTNPVTSFKINGINV